MGKSKDPQSYLATPPLSSYLEPLNAGPLPELTLGPACLTEDSNNQLAHDREEGSVSSSSPTTHPHVADVLLGTSGRRPPTRKGKPSRKTTHSQIEKRRREKINDTMQRLKDLVPACHEPDALLRKLDVLTATADYIEELLGLLRQMPSIDSTQSLSRVPCFVAQQEEHASEPRKRRSSRNQQVASYNESDSSIPSKELDATEVSDTCDASLQTRDMEVDEVNAAESLIQIAESPMLRPIVARTRLSICELMHL